MNLSMVPVGRVAIVAHDAGGAEILSSLVRRERAMGRHDHVFALAGPACHIFSTKLGSIDNLSLEQALSCATWILCGTGWQSELEFDAIRRAREMGLRSVAFLDHWVHYQERFARKGKSVLPDEIWVGDGMAHDIACKTISGIPIVNVGNPYFDDIRQYFSILPPPNLLDGASVLFVGEAIQEHALLKYGNPLHWGYTQHQALDYFLNHLYALRSAVSQILIRPHPAEDPGGYEPFLHHPGVTLAQKGDDLLLQITASDWVVGCNTMAMVVGVMAGRHVLSCIPPNGGACMLPQVEIVHLQALVSQAFP